MLLLAYDYFSHCAKMQPVKSSQLAALEEKNVNKIELIYL